MAMKPSQEFLKLTHIEKLCIVSVLKFQCAARKRFLDSYHRVHNNFVTLKTINGQDLAKMKGTFFHAPSENKRSFKQYDLLFNIRMSGSFSSAKVPFKSYSGICAGLTRYWYLSQLSNKDLLEEFKFYSFKHFSPHQRRVFEDVESMQIFQRLPSFVCIQSSPFHSKWLKYHNDYANEMCSFKNLQISSINSINNLSPLDKKWFSESIAISLKDKLFTKNNGSSVSEECINAILQDSITHPQSLTEIIFAPLQGSTSHMVGVLTCIGPDNKKIIKYFDSNTGERVLDGLDCAANKAILTEELNQSLLVYPSEDVSITIQKYNGTEKIHFNALTVLLFAYFLHSVLESNKRILNDTLNSTPEDPEKEGIVASIR